MNAIQPSDKASLNKVLKALDLIYSRCVSNPKFNRRTKKLTLSIATEDLTYFDLDIYELRYSLAEIQNRFGLIRIVDSFDFELDNLSNYPVEPNLFTLEIDNDFASKYKSLKVNLSPSEDSARKIKLGKDNERGIYRKENDTLRYQIEPDSARDKIVNALIKAKSLIKLEEMRRISGLKQNSTVMHSIEKINEQAVEKLDTNSKLITHVPRRGYEINHKEFDFE